MLFLAGQEAEVRVDDDGRDAFVVLVTEGMMVRVTVPIYAPDGTLAGKPDVTMKPGEDSSVEFSVDGTSYAVTIRTEMSNVDGSETP
jgi:hypothetical protein